jgi:acetylornithine deacetylase
MSTTQNITNSAIDLLKKMIAIPSLSREEKEVADLIEQYLQENGVTTGRLINNVYALNK